MREALAQAKALVAGCATAPAWPLSDAELIQAVTDVHRLARQVAATEVHLVRELDGRGLAKAHGATGTGRWLAGTTQLTEQTTNRLVKLAKRLDERPVLDAAASAGRVNLEQAAVIAAAVADLPADAGPTAVDAAEALLIEQAELFGADDLRLLGRHILHQVDPELAERHEREQMEKEERSAEQKRSLSMCSAGDGGVRLRGLLTREQAATVNAALDPLCSPRHTPDDTRTAAQRRCDALVDVCELALRTEHLPDHGGERPHVVITVSFDALRQELGAGTLDTGAPLTPGQVRRVCCDAMILPAVLGSDGQALDLGKTRRLFTGPVRRALVLRDGGCAFPNCSRPARWCEGHHILSWLFGGPTSVDNGVLLCGHHHRLVHQGDWQVRLAADGLPEFLPPTYVDPLCRPQRNTYHRRR
jgi:hypothetical protein